MHIDADRQLPEAHELFLDHVGHFVRDIDAARRALEAIGFAPAPTSIQVNESPDGTKSLTGTGNITAMLTRGYLEVLFKTADTPLGQEFDAAIQTCEGVKLVAFVSADAAREHGRLTNAGFNTRPIVALRRPVATATGTETAAFTVARVAPEDMPEGRIQILTHHTEAAVWQPRWLAHPNGVLGLSAVHMMVADADEAAARYASFLARQPIPNAWGYYFQLDRGGLQLSDRQPPPHLMPTTPVARPFIAGYGLHVRSLTTIERWLAAANLDVERHGNVVSAEFPCALGKGCWQFVEQPAHLPWRASDAGAQSSN